MSSRARKFRRHCLHELDNADVELLRQLLKVLKVRGTGRGESDLLQQHPPLERVAKLLKADFAVAIGVGVIQFQFSYNLLEYSSFTRAVVLD